MTDCPDKLTTGVGLIVTLQTYLIGSAFKPIRLETKDENTTAHGFNEGLETQEERSNGSIFSRRSSIIDTKY